MNTRSPTGYRASTITTAIPFPTESTNSFDQHEITAGLVAKVVMLGDSGVGKSSLVVRYVDEIFTPTIKSTVGASFFTKKFIIDDTKVKLQIWDTAGQERFRSLTPMFYRGASAAVLVFDVTNEQSFEKLKGWVEELKQNIEESIVITIAANKIDLESSTRVTKEKIKEYADTIQATIFETSAKSNTGVTDMFTSIAKQLVFIAKSPQSPKLVATATPTPEIHEERKEKGCCS